MKVLWFTGDVYN